MSFFSLIKLGLLFSRNKKTGIDEKHISHDNCNVFHFTAKNNDNGFPYVVTGFIENKERKVADSQNSSVNGIAGKGGEGGDIYTQKH